MRTSISIRRGGALAGISRRGLLAGGAAMAAAGLARPAIAQKGPIRLGLIAPLSGVYEPLGRPQLVGAQIAVEQINAAGGVDGHMLELAPRDDAIDPNKAALAMRDLISADVKLVIGPLTTATNLAVTPIVNDTDSMHLSTGALILPLTHEQFTPRHFRMVDNVFMRYRAYGQVMARKYPEVTRWGAALPDQATNLEQWHFFQRGLREGFAAAGRAAPEFADPVNFPNSTSDFRPYMQRILALQADALFAGTGGAQSVSFFVQAKGFGIGSRFKVIAETGGEVGVADGLKSNIPPVWWTSTDWYWRGYLDTPAGKALYDGAVARNGDTQPSGHLEVTHSSVQAYAMAIARAGSTRTDEVIKAMETLSWVSARGPARFRPEDHQIIVDVNILRFEAVEKNPRGWDVTDFVRGDGAALVEPPSPGRKFEES